MNVYCVDCVCSQLFYLVMTFMNAFDLCLEMATHSSILAWKIPWMEEPGRLQSMGLQRVRHGWVTSLSLSHMGWGVGKSNEPVNVYTEQIFYLVSKNINCKAWLLEEKRSPEKRASPASYSKAAVTDAAPPLPRSLTVPHPPHRQPC